MNKNEIPLYLANQYVRIVDDRKFVAAEQILWPDFTQQGPGFGSESSEVFITNLEFLRKYSRTFHFLGSQFGDWDGDTYSGETYCIASHFYEENKVERTTEMGIRYQDVIEIRDGVAKYIKRDLNVVWTEDRQLGGR
jgi:hypothetical protein